MKKMKTLTLNGVSFIVDDPDSISCEETQNLTEEQKETARQNIGAVSTTEVLDLLITFGIAPVLLDSNGAMLVENDNTILINV